MQAKRKRFCPAAETKIKYTNIFLWHSQEKKTCLRQILNLEKIQNCRVFCQLNPEPADALRKSRVLNTLENKIYTLNLTVSDCGCSGSSLGGCSGSSLGGCSVSSLGGCSGSSLGVCPGFLG